MDAAEEVDGATGDGDDAVASVTGTDGVEDDSVRSRPTGDATAAGAESGEAEPLSNAGGAVGAGESRTTVAVTAVVASRVNATSEGEASTRRHPRIQRARNRTTAAFPTTSGEE